MATGNIARIMRAAGRIIANPTASFATGTFPYGGTELGKVNQVTLTPVGEPPFEVLSEGLGEPTDELAADNRWLAAFFLRGWDDDGVELLRPGEYRAGSVTSHAMFDATKALPGRSMVASAVILALVPDDTTHANGFLIYRGIPRWTEATEMAFQRKTELGLPITVTCLRDDNDNMLRVGRLPDLELNP